MLGWINREIPADATIGLVMSVAASLILVAIEPPIPGGDPSSRWTQAALCIDFTEVVMNGMLAFLLFAGFAKWLSISAG